MFGNHPSGVGGPSEIGIPVAVPLARYPNPWANGTWQWLYLDKPAGWSPECNNHTRDPTPCAAGGCCASNASFIAASRDAARVSTWAAEQDPWLHGYFQFDWADTIARVASIDPAASRLNVDNSTPTYGAGPIRAGARWLGLNLLSELDDAVSGEYYLDRKSGDLYVLPPGGTAGTSAAALNLVVSVNTTCVTSKASYVRFENLDVKYAQGNGMELRGDHVSVVNCNVSNHGAIGIRVHGTNNAVRASQVHDVGCAGVALYSGKRNASLLPGNSTIATSHLHRFSRWKRMYQPGIGFDCVGCTFAGNTMYDAPHSGMLGHCNDCLVEANNFTQLCTESGDAGAFYTGRSWADRGNSIVGNHFDRIVNFGLPIPLQAPNVHCIHFDDQMSGYLVQNNTFNDSWVGVMLGGGRRTAIVHNTFSNVHIGVEFDNRGQTWQSSMCTPPNGEFFEELRKDKADQPPWSRKYPYLQHIAQDHPCLPCYNTISWNTFSECDEGISASASNIAKWLSVATNNTVV